MAQGLTQPPPWATSGYLTEDEAADYTRTPVGTLRRWRRIGQGPIAVKQPNGRIYYPQHLLDQWKDQLVQQAIAEAEQLQPGPGRGRRRRAQPQHPGDGLRVIPA
jgi:hypothetical protein